MPRSDPARSLPVALLRAAHPRQTLITAAGLAIAATLSGRPGREIGLVLVTVLVGQAVLGWHNDIVDHDRDAAHDVPGKPIAQRQLDAGTATFAVCVGVLALIPLAISGGPLSGTSYLAAVAIGLLSNVALRTGPLSWLPWALGYALLVPFLSYGGWNGIDAGSAPTPIMVGLFALLGLGAHVATSLPGLVRDHQDGWRSLPLRIALRTGAPRLLILTLCYLAGVSVVILIMGQQVGLRQ